MIEVLVLSYRVTFYQVHANYSNQAYTHAGSAERAVSVNTGVFVEICESFWKAYKSVHVSSVLTENEQERITFQIPFKPYFSLRNVLVTSTSKDLRIMAHIGGNIADSFINHKNRWVRSLAPKTT